MTRQALRPVADRLAVEAASMWSSPRGSARSSCTVPGARPGLVSLDGHDVLALRHSQSCSFDSSCAVAAQELREFVRGVGSGKKKRARAKRRFRRIGSTVHCRIRWYRCATLAGRSILSVY
jgi:hypothetical protein